MKWMVNLEVVVRFQFSPHDIHLVIVGLLDLAKSLTHLGLPVFTVLGSRVPVGQGLQFLQLLIRQQIKKT